MLTIYAPSNKPESKCWEVFNGVKKSNIIRIKDGYLDICHVSVVIPNNKTSFYLIDPAV